MSTNRTRSPRLSSIGPASENFLPSKPQMKRSMLPVRCSVISCAGGRGSPPGFSAQIGISEDAAARRKTIAGALQTIGRHHRDIVDADFSFEALALGAQLHTGHLAMLHA